MVSGYSQDVSSRFWQLSLRRRLWLDRPRIMAILNVTPDSFADAGRHFHTDAAVEAASRFVEEGADIIDVGGESTRPGAIRVPADEQIRRVVPVIRGIRALPGATGNVPLSVDTTLAEVAAAALDAGADAINDVSAGLEDACMLDLAARSGAGIVLMHRLMPPEQDSYSDRYLSEPRYSEAGVVADIRAFLAERAQAAEAAGVARECIVIDPGLGFGKTVKQNLALIDGTPEIVSLGYPVLSGLSRKSFVGRLTLARDSTPPERLEGTLRMSLRHWRAGASIFRVHDVHEHVAAFGKILSENDRFRI
jgi:dihydropteroate synthase